MLGYSSRKEGFSDGDPCLWQQVGVNVRASGAGLTHFGELPEEQY